MIASISLSKKPETSCFSMAVTYIEHKNNEHFMKYKLWRIKLILMQSFSRKRCLNGNTLRLLHTNWLLKRSGRHWNIFKEYWYENANLLRVYFSPVKSFYSSAPLISMHNTCKSLCFSWRFTLETFRKSIPTLRFNLKHYRKIFSLTQRFRFSTKTRYLYFSTTSKRLSLIEKFKQILKWVFRVILVKTRTFLQLELTCSPCAISRLWRASIKFPKPVRKELYTIVSSA